MVLKTDPTVSHTATHLNESRVVKAFCAEGELQSRKNIHLILVGLATGGVIPSTRSFQMLKNLPSDSVSKSPILSCQKYVNYTPHLQISYIQSIQRVSSLCKHPCIRMFLSGGALGIHLNRITLKIWVVSSKDSDMPEDLCSSPK